jgi:methionyl-tRNA formyltransferase
MRIVFIGAVYFSKIMLETIIEKGAQVVGVVTKNESSFNSDFSDLSIIAKENGIPYFYVHDINEQSSLLWIKQMTPDIIFCFGWSSLIKKDLLNIPPMGVVGFHPTLLPSNRGRHPLIWAKVIGLKKSGTSFFFMDEGADTGDLLDQKEFDILFEDDAASLYNKMTDNAIHQVEYFLPKLQENKYPRIKQVGLGNTWRKRVASDGLIDFRMNSKTICNLIRGLTKPYVGAHCVYKGEEIKVWESEVSFTDQINSEPGKVLDLISENIIVKTSDGAISLTRHDFLTLPKIGTYIK